MQSDFLSSVSHELRTPITSILMFIEALQNERLTDPVERAKCLTILKQEMVRLDGLVTKLIELSRIESGRQPFTNAPVAVQKIVDDALAAFMAASLHSAVQVDVRVDPGLSVSGDQAALSQALTNLLTNAWKYTGTDKQIELTVRPVGEREVEFVVSDNGPGIARDERKLIFEKFERGTAAKRGGATGSGLGLAIVQAIARAHKGRVELGAAETGASFHLVLPRRKG
jgi:signal transduction histidine kinase